MLRKLSLNYWIVSGCIVVLLVALCLVGSTIRESLSQKSAIESARYTGIDQVLAQKCAQPKTTQLKSDSGEQTTRVAKDSPHDRSSDSINAKILDLPQLHHGDVLPVTSEDVASEIAALETEKIATAKQQTKSQTAPQKELPVVNDRTDTESGLVANRFVSSNPHQHRTSSRFTAEEEQRLGALLSRVDVEQKAHRKEAERISKLIAEHAATAAENGETAMNLPPICLSPNSGWIPPNNSAHSTDGSTKSHEQQDSIADVMTVAAETAIANQRGSSMPIHSTNRDQSPGEVAPIETHSSQKKAAALNPSQMTPEAIRRYNPHAKASAASAKLTSGMKARQFDGTDPHADVFSCDCFPSATDCKKCHEQIYDEWSSSSHAYASVSPMFHKFEQKINDLAQGTIGYFCMRCHAPVATTNKHRRDVPIWDGPRVFREGVTCIACHRVKEQFGKVNGERRIEPGTINEPVYGTSDGMGVEEVLKYKTTYKVKTDPNDKSPGLQIHRRAIQFEQLNESSFCASCHQVAVQPGIKLEVVWDQYRASPAHREGTTCQDCHMGKIPGVDEGYSIGPAAQINNLAVKSERKHSNHAFYGPGYSIAHPGIFPQNPDADRWHFNDWLMFDWRGGWGTDEFEDALADGQFEFTFPEAWADADDRYDAREVIDANLKKLKYKTDLRRQVMENGSKINGPFFKGTVRTGKPLKFHYQVCNTNRGHNMPSGSLGAQPQLWLNVVLIGPDGTRLWESGYQDSVGDLADIHSEDVLHNRVPFDRQLFNLQTKFLITNVKGTDREFPLPVNMDIDQIPFIRPGAVPVTTLNHPPFIRMEAHSISPLGSRDAKYRVPGHLIQQPGTYRLSVRLRSRAEPIYFMKFVGATPEMIRMMNEGIVDAHPYTVAFEVQ